MKKTKIVATLGPACDGPGVIAALIREGVNIFRLNFSHGTPQDHARRVSLVRAESKKLGAPVGILQDISGPKIRIGELNPKIIEFKTGDSLTLTTQKMLGSKKLISVNYPALPRDVKKGDLLYLADGAIEVEIRDVNKTLIHCRITNAGRLSSHQGINFPGGTLSAKSLTAKDRKDLKFGVGLGVDMIALSFVRNPKEIEAARRLLLKFGARSTPVIAKIEKHEAMDNLYPILEAADGAMVARGDLGVEIPLEEVPLAQKKIIQLARHLGRPVIVATHMLASMVNRPRPSRAEAADITTAVLDGTDALMLSEETAVGTYPIEAVKIMAKIARNAESSIDHRRYLRDTPIGNSVSEAISHATCAIAQDIKAKAIITPTALGTTARRVSRLRPSQPVLALSHNPQILRFLNLHWGVFPIEIERARTIDHLFDLSVKAARNSELLKKGDLTVITAGAPLNRSGSTNLIKAQRIE